jgi:hypothetical protein
MLAADSQTLNVSDTATVEILAIYISYANAF